MSPGSRPKAIASGGGPRMSPARALIRLYARVFATPRLNWWHGFLYKWALHGLGVGNYYDPGVSGEAYFVEAVLPRLVKRQEPVFLDVGANAGAYSRMLVSTFSGARVFAFEPNPRSYRALAASGIQGLQAFQIALGARNGPTRLYDLRDDDGSTDASLYKEVIQGIWGRHSISHGIALRTLDRVCKDLGLESIDLLKVDTEGSELDILRGGARLIERGRIRVIQFEFNEMNTISHACMRDFRAALHGFTLWRLLPRGLTQLPSSTIASEIYGYQNIIAIADSVKWIAP